MPHRGDELRNTFITVVLFKRLDGDRPLIHRKFTEKVEDLTGIY